MNPLRIALCTHSTNPRGGVAHALSMGEALHDLGHQATVFAPDFSGDGFRRPVRCRTHTFPGRKSDGDLFQFVQRCIADYVDCLEQHDDSFDIFHAHDGISGNAVATLAKRGRIEGFIRTIHHLDEFADPRLGRLQDRSLLGALSLVCVSQKWAQHIRRSYGRRSAVIPNGVDLSRFSPTPTPRDAALRDELRLGSGPVFLSVGGVEARKNSIALLRAFCAFHANCPSARLIFAGGASLLDHDSFRGEFNRELSRSHPDARKAVQQPGVVSDADMPPLIRTADALLFPSIKEGFGLVVLEAMACGTPVVTSRIAPFTEYLEDGDCAWCEPNSLPSITAAMQHALDAAVTLQHRGLAVARRFPWSAAARRHEQLYRSLVWESAHAGNAF